MICGILPEHSATPAQIPNDVNPHDIVVIVNRLNSRPYSHTEGPMQ